MKVTLIDYTGIGQPDPSDYAARLLVYIKSTRLQQGAETRDKIFRQMSQEEIDKEVDYIANTLRSSWEFIDYTVEIQGVTRAFTHQLVRTRTASYAQQAQRVVNLGDSFNVTKPVTIDDPGKERVWAEAVNTVKGAYSVLQAMGVPTQDARGLLPTNIQTNIIMKLNLRTMADLVGKRINPRAQGEYIDFMKLLVAEVLTVHPWTSTFLFPERLATPALDKILLELTGDDSPYSREDLNAALKEVDKLKATWG